MGSLERVFGRTMYSNSDIWRHIETTAGQKMTAKLRRTAFYLLLTSYLTSSTPTSQSSTDLGFSVLDDQILRENIGVGIHNQQDKSDKRSDTFFGDEAEF